MMQLSSKQQLIVDRLNDGWELGVDQTKGGGVWMQKGGLGQGGESDHRISYATFHVLLAKGLIVLTKRGFPTNHYGLPKEATP